MKKVLVFGVFDGFHAGHLDFFRQAWECTQSDPVEEQVPTGRAIDENADTHRTDDVWLVACVTRDDVVELLKGRRSKNDIEFRMREVGECEYVDEVVEGDERPGSWEVVGKVRPDVIALGYDQEALEAALRQHVEAEGLDLEICVMKPYKPEEFHSSIISI